MDFVCWSLEADQTLNHPSPNSAKSFDGSGALYKYPLSRLAPIQELGKLPTGTRGLYPNAGIMRAECRRATFGEPPVELAPDDLPEYMVEVQVRISVFGFCSETSD